MSFHTVFFDLDGTLSDSKPGIIRSFQHALQAFGVKAEPESLEQYIGPPLRESFGKLGFDNDSVDAVIAKFRERYKTKGVYELSLYPGIAEMIEVLHGKGKTLVLATSKAEDSAILIMEHTKLAPKFTAMAGADLVTGRLKKADVLRHACEKAGITDMDGCLMIGDREHDVHGAHALGMPCAAVLYGYGSRKELKEAGPEYLFESVADLRDWLIVC